MIAALFRVVCLTLLLACTAHAQAPKITSYPLSKIAVVGDAVSFSLGATGTGLTYRWLHNGSVIAGASTSTLTLPAVTLQDRGWYRAEVSVPGARVSAVCMLDVGVANGKVVSWGDYAPEVPASLGPVLSLGKGAHSPVVLALKTDGTVAAWGREWAGPALEVPADLKNVVGVAGGRSGCIAVKADGRVVMWGSPAPKPPYELSDIVAVTAGYNHFLALRADGTVVTWGEAPYGMPSGLADVVGIGASHGTSLALLADGKTVAWGSASGYAPAAASLKAVSAGGGHLLGITYEDRVVAWGSDYSGSTKVPSDVVTASAIAAGESHSLAVRVDGTVAAWGRNLEHQADVPPHLGQVVSVSASYPSSAVFANVAPAITYQPSSQSVAAGDFVQLRVRSTGGIPLTFEWRKNGEPIVDGGTVSGATTDCLMINGAAPSDAGTYSVRVFNDVGSTTSEPAVLTVSTPPTFTKRPLSRMVSLGGSATFSVEATDAAPLTYQWKRNGRIIEGQTSSSYTLGSAGLGDSGFYEVVVSNGTVSSRTVFRVHVVRGDASDIVVMPLGRTEYGVGAIPPEATGVVQVAAEDYHVVALKSDGTVVTWGSAGTTPAGLNNVIAVAVGDNFSLALKADGTVVSWSGGWTPPAIPIWLRDVVAISARGGNALALTAAGKVVGLVGFVPADLGDVIAISAGQWHSLALRSDGTVLGWNLYDPNADTQVPPGLTGVIGVEAGDSHSLALKSDGTVMAWGSNTYGAAAVPHDLTGVVSIEAGYNHSIAQLADGTLRAWGSDFNGVITDAQRVGPVADVESGSTYALALAQRAVPSFRTHPATATVNAGEPVMLSADAAGIPLPTLQWKRNGIAIAGATGATLTLSAAASGDAGDYTVTATNAVGQATSNIARLSVVPPLAVVTRTLSQLVELGQPVRISISTPSAVAYQWRHNGNVIIGATRDTYDIAAAALSDRGRYEVIATDAAGGGGRAVSYLEVAPARGTVVTWAVPNFSGSLPPAPPSDLGRAVSVAYGGFSAGLCADGTVRTWGDFAPTVKAGSTGVVAIAAGNRHLLALKSDGTVVVSGTGGYGETNVPAEVRDVVAIAAGGWTSYALRADGTLVVWGDQNPGIPADLAPVVAVASGAGYAIALRTNGTVRSWGSADYGQVNVPAGLANVAHISTSSHESVAVRRDGSVVAWGTIEAPPASLAGVVAAVGGGESVLALKTDGTLATWGRAKAPLPTIAGSVSAIAASSGRYLAVADVPRTGPEIVSAPALTVARYGDDVTIEVVAMGTPVLHYAWSKDGQRIGDQRNVSGTNTAVLKLRQIAASAAGQYTVFIQNAFGTVTSSPMELRVESLRVTAAGDAGAGGSTTLSVNAPPGATYQWRYLGSNIAGATNATLVLDGLSRGKNGAYDVVVTTAEGSSVAHAYVLDVQPTLQSDIYDADPAFSPRLECAGRGAVNASITLPDGKFLVGGDFTSLDGQPVAYLARLNADGSLDTTYTPPLLTGPVHALLMQSDGKVYVGGEFTFVNGTRSGRIVRLNADLTPDPTFVVGLGFNAPVRTLVLQANGQLAVGGEFTAYNNAYANRLCQLSQEGAVIPGFTLINTHGPVYVIRPASDGKFLVGGGVFGDAGTSASGFVLRLNSDGTIDSTWPSPSWGGVSYSAPVLAIAETPDHCWFVGGAFQDLLRLSATGAPDSSFVFDPQLKAQAKRITTILVDTTGRPVIAGHGLPIAAMNTEGARLSGFPAQPFSMGEVQRAEVTSEGAVRFWGRFETASGIVAGFARLAPGSVSFDAPAGPEPRTLAEVFDAQNYGNGQFMLRGSFTHVDGIARQGIARFDAEGALDTSFDAGSVIPLSNTGPFAKLGDGRLLVHNGSELIRLAANGSVDPTYVGPAYTAGTLVVDREGRCLIANGGPGLLFGNGYGIRRLAPDGALDPAFSVVTSGPVATILVQPSGRIVIDGGFGTLNGKSVDVPVRLFQEGAVDPGFFGGWRGGGRLIGLVSTSNGNLLRSTDWLELRGADGQYVPYDYPGWTYDPVTAFLPLPSGKVLRALPSSAYTVGGLDWVLGRHNADGALDSAFAVDGLDETSTRIDRMLLLDDGSILLFGRNLTADGLPQLGPVRVAPAVPVSIASEPQSLRTGVGEEARFSVVAAGTGPLKYQWYFNAMPLAGATGATLTLPNAQIAQAGAYTVRVTGPFGFVTSSAAQLSGPNTAPSITSQPTHSTGTAGGSATFAVTATGTGSLAYQWRRSGSPLGGATGATLTLNGLTRADAGLYDVLVADGLSVTVSNTARLSVAPRSYADSLTMDRHYQVLLERPGGRIEAVVPIPGGRYLVSGGFSRIRGVSRPGLAIVNKNLVPEPSFDPPADVGNPRLHVDTVNYIRAVGSTPDGKMLVVQPMTFGHGRLLRLRADGAIDTSFSFPATNAGVHTVAVQADGRILVGGYDARGHSLYRVNTDGSFDAAYGPSIKLGTVDANIYGIVPLPDGKALVVGNFNTVNGTRVSAGLVRLLADGSLDTTFAVTGVAEPWVSSVAVGQDGRLIAAGNFGPSSSTRSVVVRLSASGAFETSLLSEANAPAVSRVEVQSNGKILATAIGSAEVRAWQLSATGTLERSFRVPNNGSSVGTVSDGEDGLITGILHVSEAGCFSLVRHAPTGAQLAIVWTEAPADVTCVTPAIGGRHFVAGDFTRVNGTPRHGLARLNADGTLDPSFDPGRGAGGEIQDIAAGPDGTLYVTGAFTSFNDEPALDLVRLHSDGSRDRSFAVSVRAQLWDQRRLTVLRDGRVVVGAHYAYFPNGALDERFDPKGHSGWVTGVTRTAARSDGGMMALSSTSLYAIDAGGVVTSPGVVLHRAADFAILPDERWLFSGAMYALDGAYGMRARVTRTSAAFIADSSYASGTLWTSGWNVYSGARLLAQEDGRALLHDGERFARLNADGTLDAGFGIPGLRVLYIPWASPRTANAFLLTDDGALLVGDRLLEIDGIFRRGVFRYIDTRAVQVPTPLADTTVLAGESAVFEVSPMGTGPFTYQWFKDGVAIAGATNARYTLATHAVSDAGQYSVAVSNAFGPTQTISARLEVRAPTAPSITEQPRSASVVAGGVVTFSVSGTGLPAPRYQWLKTGVAIAGATAASYTIASATLDDAGAYTVEVSNVAGTVVSRDAVLYVRPTGTNAVHVISANQEGASPTLTITNTVTFSGAPSGLTFEVLLPEGWAIASTTGSATTAPAVGTTSLAEWRWTSVGGSPLVFSYTLAIPGTRTATDSVTARVTLNADKEIQFLANPDPLLLLPRHSADTDSNRQISLLELTRVIELFNTRFGGLRTGCYKVDAAGEDGFAPEPLRTGSVTLAQYHSADSNRDGNISLIELTRVIELYNYRTGTSRTGQYRVQPGTEDGFAPGP